MGTERKTLAASALIALMLALWGIGMGIYSESGAIMLDGTFNLLSAIMSFLGLKVAYLTTQGYTERYPLGFFAYEPLLVMVKGISILILVTLALTSNIQLILAGGRDPQLGTMLVYVLPAVSGCLLAWLLCRNANNKNPSGLLGAEQQAWLINAVISGAIGIALFIVLLIEESSFGWIARYIDQILVILFCLAFLKDPYVLVKNGFKELLLTAPDKNLQAPLRNAISSLEKDPDFQIKDITLLKTGRRVWVNITVSSNNHEMPLKSFYQYRDKLNQCAHKCYSNCHTEVTLEELQ